MEGGREGVQVMGKSVILPFDGSRPSEDKPLSSGLATGSADKHESGQLSARSTPEGCRAGLGANRKGHRRKGPRPWWPTSPSKGALRPWRTLAQSTPYQSWHSTFPVLFLLDFSLKYRPQGGMAHWGPTRTPSGVHRSGDCFQMSLAPGNEK